MNKTISLISSMIFLAGCAVGPNYQPPPIPTQSAFGSASGLEFTNSNLISSWWNGFNDPLLDRLILNASTNNHDYRIAQARLHETRALWTAARFDFAPTVRNENYYQKSQSSRALIPEGQNRRGELYRAGFDATWELDLWGAVRRNVEAARATLESVEASLEDVLVSVRAEVAANYIELRGLQAQLATAQRNATNQSETLKLAEALRDGGQGTQLDVARASSQLSATRAGIPPLQAAADLAIHRISVLCGLPPGELRAELSTPAPLPVPPENLALDTPGAVLRRRPDVRAAERALAADTARIGVAVGDLFPRVTFSGSVGLQASSFSGLGDSGADTWGLGPHISWAAFDLGRVRQRIKAANARSEASLAIYEQTVLLALEETENTLVTFGRERERLFHLRASERAGAEAVELARQRYRDGIADFLSVLDAERTLLTLQEQLVTSETRAVTSLVAVYKSLAGGL